MMGDQPTGYMQAVAAAVTNHYDDMFVCLVLFNCAKPRGPALGTRRNDKRLSVFALVVMITFEGMRQRGQACFCFSFTYISIFRLLPRLHRYCVFMNAYKRENRPCNTFRSMLHVCIYRIGCQQLQPLRQRPLHPFSWDYLHLLNLLFRF